MCYCLFIVTVFWNTLMRACGSPNEEDPWVSEPLIGKLHCVCRFVIFSCKILCYRFLIQLTYIIYAGRSQKHTNAQTLNQYLYVYFWMFLGTGECKPMKKKSQKNCRNVFNVSNDMKTIRKMFCKCILFFSWKSLSIQTWVCRDT